MVLEIVSPGDGFEAEAVGFAPRARPGTLPVRLLHHHDDAGRLPAKPANELLEEQAFADPESGKSRIFQVQLLHLGYGGFDLATPGRRP